MPPRGAGRVSGADDRAAMKSNWTLSRDKRLLGQQAAGRTAAQIAKSLGVSRNAVIGRSRRLRGIVYKSDIESWARANARRSQEAKKRMKVRQKAQRKALRELARAVARGEPKGKAMARAHRGGALWRQIGEQFGVSQQAAYEKAKTWTQRQRR
jgi:Zn-dependent peptidase ImmA (M78 family)